MLHFKAGDMIHEDEPYTAVVSSQSIDCVCSFCFGNHVEFKCSLCGHVSYCSEQCQQEDFLHDRVECMILANLDNLPEDEVRLVIRTAARKIYEQRKGYVSFGSFFGQKRKLENLVGHVEDLSVEEMKRLTMKLSFVQAVLENFGFLLELDELVEIYMKCQINSHIIVDHNEPDYLSRGQAIYLAASHLNHTCVPTDDYILRFDGRNLMIRATKDFILKDPSDLRTQYVPTNLAYNDRRDRLLKTYLFLCSCDRCVFQARFPETEAQCSPKHTQEIVALLKKFDPASTDWFENAVMLLEKVEDAADSEFHVHWLLIHAQQAAAQLRRFPQSLQYGTRALKGAVSVMGIQRILFRLCSSMKHLGWNQKTSEHFENFKESKRIAKRLFTITHGKNHPLVKMISAPIAASDVQTI